MILYIFAEEEKLFLLPTIRGKGFGLEYHIMIRIQFDHIETHQFIENNTRPYVTLGNIGYQALKGLVAEFIIILQRKFSRGIIRIEQTFVADPARNQLRANRNICRPAVLAIRLSPQPFYVFTVNTG